MEKKIKYYLVKHSYESNYKWRTSYCYTTDKAKAEERFNWANSYFDFYDVDMLEIYLTESEVEKMLNEIGKDMIAINHFNKDYFIC